MESKDTAVQAPLALHLPPPKPIVGTDQQGSIKESFNRFHDANPHVYQALAQIALHAARRGRKVGIGAIYERLRWEYTVETDEEYKLNNNYRSHYARLLMENIPELDGYFETRKLRSK